MKGGEHSSQNSSQNMVASPLSTEGQCSSLEGESFETRFLSGTNAMIHQESRESLNLHCIDV